MIGRLLASTFLAAFSLSALSAQVEGKLFCEAVPGLAVPGQPGPGESPPFSLSVGLDGGLLFLGLGLAGASLIAEAAQPESLPDSSPGGLSPEAVQPWERGLMAPYSRPLDKLGTGLSIAALLTPGLALFAPREEWCALGTMYGETLLLAYGLKELGKALVGRPRPYMYFPDYPLESVEDGEWDESFPSGHVALAFAGASFAAYVLGARFPDSEFLGPVIATGYALALGTAACRIASGDHFLSDVLAGAGIGSLSGFLVPWLHSLGKPSAKTEAREGGLSLEAQGIGLALTVRY